MTGLLACKVPVLFTIFYRRVGTVFTPFRFHQLTALVTPHSVHSYLQILPTVSLPLVLQD